MHYELTKSFGTALAIDSTRHNAASIACSLSTGIEAFNVNVVKLFIVAGNAQRRRGSSLNTYHYGLIGQETTRLTVKEFEAFGQTM